MSDEITILALTAASIGLLHTLLGPDHYLPFIAMAKARSWPLRKTAWITVLCGLGHVAGSIVLGMVGIAAGIAVRKLEVTESVRGEVAAWLLISFGLLYFVWGLRRAWRNKPHTHAHGHIHDGEDAHVHGRDATAKSKTPWVLFLIFVFGPCEPLIPILMYPAASLSLSGVALVTAVFAVTTIGTMLSVVLLSTFGLKRLAVEPLERYSHALAGSIILACGIAIQFGL